MAVHATDYRQKATYWGSPVPDGYGGHSFTKSEIYCRWEERVEEFTDQVGEMHISKAVVFVLEDLDIGGYLYLGTSAQSDPSGQDGAFEIKQLRKIPDLRNVVSERRVYL